MLYHVIFFARQIAVMFMSEADVAGIEAEMSLFLFLLTTTDFRLRLKTCVCEPHTRLQ